jgi:cytoskeleton protein RodZ
VTEETETGRVPAEPVGTRLKSAREARGLTLGDITERTKIPIRHLESIEASNFEALPGRTYSIGFVRSYSRALDLSAENMVDDLRLEMSTMEGMQRYRPRMEYDAEDPAKIPSAKLAWIAAAVGVALLVGAFVVWRASFMPGSDTGANSMADAASPAAPAVPPPSRDSAPAAPTTGPVVFTATDDGIWVKFYDGDGNQLMQKQMAKGETYTVPEDAKDPQIWTGRPDAFDITVGGASVAPLGNAEEIIKDVPVSASALAARSTDNDDSAGTASEDRPI